jgi:membrane-bound ClpP family serine protease
MSLFLIILIILIGLFFLFVEVFLIPGTSVLAILGIVVILVGIYLGYKEYGSVAGNWMVVGSLIGTGVTMYIGINRIRSKQWGLHTVMDSKVNVNDFSEYAIGDKGVAASDIRPEGKAHFSDNRRVNVYSMGEFIDAETPIEIIKIQHNKIYVQPIKE